MFIFTVLLVIGWAMVFSAARFVQYYRISKNYNSRVDAKVDKVTFHEPKNKKEHKTYDVFLEYKIDGKKGRAQINVPVEKIDEFEVGSKIPIRYKIEDNGAIRIASDSQQFDQLAKVHFIAVIVELIMFFILWWHWVS